MISVFHYIKIVWIVDLVCQGFRHTIGVQKVWTYINQSCPSYWIFETLGFSNKNHKKLTRFESAVISFELDLIIHAYDTGRFLNEVKIWDLKPSATLTKTFVSKSIEALWVLAFAKFCNFFYCGCWNNLKTPEF